MYEPKRNTQAQTYVWHPSKNGLINISKKKRQKLTNFSRSIT